MSGETQRDIQAILLAALERTNDVVGVFDAQDVLIYCNEGFAKLFALTKSEGTGVHFSDIIKNCYLNDQGMNIETDNIDDWLAYAYSVRRQSEFRSFEADTCDDQWYRLTEQLIDDYIFIYGTNITEAKHTEFALKKAQKELRAAAITDALTGAFNRRFFNENVAAELDRAKRKHVASSLLIIDADNFKQVNDQFGHDVGDFVLQEITRRVASQLRVYDLFCRIGGEEFAIFLPETSIAKAALIAQRCIDTIGGQPFKFHQQTVPVTVSIGIADSEDGSISLEKLYKEADSSLFDAKRMGKNQFHYSRTVHSMLSP